LFNSKLNGQKLGFNTPLKPDLKILKLRVLLVKSWRRTTNKLAINWQDFALDSN